MKEFAVVGDWGTSRLRLFRVEDGRCVARREGPGIGALDGTAAVAVAFADTVSPWLADGLPQSITLCGMVGARDGWVEAPYADCPCDVDRWRAAAAGFDWRGAPLAIMAGLACVGADGLPDVMRGEETQIFGAMILDPSLAQGRHRIVLPGTHNKWALVEDGRVLGFRTMPTGELFALLRDHSTLAPRGLAAVDPDDEAVGFIAGLDQAGGGKMLQSLFAARAMRLRAGRSESWALGYISGLLIGCEVAEAAADGAAADDVVLIGDTGLSGRYARALAATGRGIRSLDGDACALAGLGFRGDMAA